MNVEQLNAEIRGVQKDIGSLQQEINPLTEQYKALCEALKQLEESVEHAHEDEDDDIYESPPPPVQQGESKSKAAEYDDAIPPLLQHSHFDDSIAKYFTDSFQSEHQTTESNSKRQKLGDFSFDILSRANETIEIKENVLFENIFRFGGITAFPVTKTLFKDDDEILGLRFDIFSHFANQFKVPHYIILKKIDRGGKHTDNSDFKWSIYRHTIPVYVPLEEYDDFLLTGADLDSGLQKFAHAVRDYLIRVQYKHDKFDSLVGLTFADNSIDKRPAIQKVDKDLECKRVLLLIPNPRNIKNKPHEIELICSNTSVQSVSISVMSEKSPQTTEKILYAQNLLRDTDIKDLIKKTRAVLAFLKKEQII